MLCLSHLVKSKLTYRVFKLKSAGGQTFVAKGAAGVKQSGQVIENFKISIRIRLGIYFLLLENFGRVHRNQNKKLKATSINVTKYLFEFQRSSRSSRNKKKLKKKFMD